jgi:hypothetical protein
MDFLDFLTVFFWEVFAMYRLFQEECVVHVSCGMGLRLEKGVKVPE